MNTLVTASPSWSTAAFGNTAGTSAVELSALGAHLDVCKGSRGPLFAAHCVADAMHGFVAGRFVTTLVAVALLIGAMTLLL